METSKDHILQCRNNDVWASGNLSFSNPKLEIKHLSYVPQVILSQDFPIIIKNRQIFADEICGSAKLFLSKPRQKFSNFYKKSPTFLFDKDDKHNVSSQLSFIHSTLKRIQRVRARHIVEVAKSPRFIFSCLFALVLVIILLSLCFCPSLFVKIVKNIFESILQLATYIVERLVHLFTAFGSMFILQ